MRNLLLFLHVAAAVLWMGGMGFMLLALRPSLAVLEPPHRLQLMSQVLGRFFRVVEVSSATLLLTGGWLLGQASGQAPAGWHVMAALGLAMVLVFGFILWSPWRRMKQAMADGNLATAAACAARIARLALLNFVLGWIAIAAVLLWR